MLVLEEKDKQTDIQKSTKRGEKKKRRKKKKGNSEILSWASIKPNKHFIFY